jgi:Ca2+-binding RTX toxin-like protein
MMRPSTVVRLLVLAAAFLVLASGSFAFTAANTVPATKAGTQTFTIDANALKPASCASLNLSAIVTNNNPGNAAELILGTAAADTINGKSGDDCILGGGGNDSITGGPGTDVCIGGPGTDTFASCETQVQ